MGNSTSTPTVTPSDLERFTDATKYVTHPLLQQRFELSERPKLQKHLETFTSDHPNISKYWIAVMQTEGIIDWSSTFNTVKQCIGDIAWDKASYGYVEALIDHIVMKGRNERREGLNNAIAAIIDLASGMAHYWKLDDPTYSPSTVRLHQVAANAIHELHHLVQEDEYGDDEDTISNIDKGLDLYDRFEHYRIVGLFRGAQQERYMQEHTDYTSYDNDIEDDYGDACW